MKAISRNVLWIAGLLLVASCARRVILEESDVIGTWKEDTSPADIVLNVNSDRTYSLSFKENTGKTKSSSLSGVLSEAMQGIAWAILKTNGTWTVHADTLSLISGTNGFSTADLKITETASNRLNCVMMKRPYRFVK